MSLMQIAGYKIKVKTQLLIVKNLITMRFRAMWKQIGHCIKYLNIHMNDIVRASNILFGPGVGK